jgi:hypothetical protein
MNLSPEALEQVLTELADRADGHHVVDRVPAIRGRARRNARRRAGAMVTAVAVLAVVGSGVARFGGGPLLHGESPQPATTPAPTGPYLTVQLVRDEKTEATITPQTSGGRVVVVDVILHGRVPQASDYQAGAVSTDNLRELAMTADGRPAGSSSLAEPGFHCAPGVPLVDVDTSFLMTLQLAAEPNDPVVGPHHLTFTTDGCAPVGEVQQSLDIVVK